MRSTTSRSTSLRSTRFTVAIALSLGALVLALIPATQPRAEAYGYSPVLDRPARYEAQVTCTKSPQPGTLKLARYLLYRYPATRSMGLMRSCGSGGRSEHKDGRAFDWGADVKRSSTRNSAYHFIKAVRASDKWGNKAALGRRLGIMYMIYNDTIWSSYRNFEPKPYLHASCTSKAKCSRSKRHLDHVHISLGYSGAAAQTSWYRQRNVPNKPVFYPRTGQLDPDNTAITSFFVKPNGKLTESPFLLKAGVTYRIVVTGVVRYGPGRDVGDANCSRAANGWSYELADRGPLPLPLPEEDSWSRDRDHGGWGSRHEGSDHPTSLGARPTAATKGLILHKLLRWEGGCRLDHTYETWFTPKIKQRLAFKYLDDDYSDNSGKFRVWVARDDITAASLSKW